MNNPQSVSITTETFIRALLVGVGALFIFLIRDILLILLVSVVIASAATPAVDFFSRFNFPRAVSAGIVYASAAAMFAIFFYFFVPIIVAEVSGFLTTLPQYSSEILPEALEQSGDIAGASFNEISANIRALLGTFSGSILGTTAVVFGGLFNFTLIISISFYLLIQKNGVARFLSYAIPLKYTERALSLWVRSQRKISDWFRGMAIASLAVGISVYIGLLLLGVPYAFLLALLSGLLNFVPIIGPIISTVPAAVVGFAEGGALIGVLTVLLFVFIQALESHVLYPIVVGRSVGVSPIVILLAVGIGSKLGGFLGILLAVPFSAIFMEFVADMRAQHKANKKDKEREKPSSETPEEDVM
jgi:predicted PurR-regulated permease PerM